MHFEIISDIEEIKTIAIGGNIRDIMRQGNNSVPVDGESLKV